MSEAKAESGLSKADVRRVEGGVWLRVVIAGVGASGVISVEDARRLGDSLIDTAWEPRPKPKGGK